LTALLIMGLLGMHALIGGAAASTPSMAPSAHASSPSAATRTTASVSSESAGQRGGQRCGVRDDALKGGEATDLSATAAERLPPPCRARPGRRGRCTVPAAVQTP